MSFKRGKQRRVDPFDVRVVWKSLPHSLKTFDGWLYGDHEPEGLRDWYGAVSRCLGARFGSDPRQPSVWDVAAVGGLSMAGWYALRLAQEGDRRLMVVE